MRHSRKGKQAVLPSSPAWSLGIRRNAAVNGDQPGPATYQPRFESSSQLLHRDAPLVGSPRPFRSSQHSQPGPGSYNASDMPLHRQAAKWTLGGRPALSAFNHQTPGPGAYTAGYQGHSALGNKFGQSKRLASSCTGSPGPGEYEPAKHGAHGPGYSLKFRHDGLLAESASPGPGAYTPSLPSRHSSPVYSMHSARPAHASVPLAARGEGGANVLAEPSASQTRLNRTGNQGWVGTRSPRFPSAPTGTDSPGPGAYLSGVRGPHLAGNSVRSDHRSAPASTIGARAGGRDGASTTPGPGTYNGKVSATHPRAPASSICGRGSTGGGSGSSWVPGPGAYRPDAADALVRQGHAKVSIGSRLRGLEARSADPGPGSYTLPSVQGSIAASLKFRHCNQSGAAITDMLGARASSGGFARKQGGNTLPTTKGHPAWSIAARLPVHGMAITPGPGQYDHE